MPDDRLTAAQRTLAAATARAKRKALGPVLTTTDADLDALAQVGPADAGEVEAFVRQAAGAQGVALFRAEADTNE